MAGYELVQLVQDGRPAENPEGPAQRLGQPELAEKGDAAAGVALDRRAVTQDEPPTLVAGFLGDGHEQGRSFLISERQEGQLLAAVELDGEPRRPSTEPSGARVEMHRPHVPAIRHRVVRCHFAEPTSPLTGMFAGGGEPTAWTTSAAP